MTEPSSRGPTMGRTGFELQRILENGPEICPVCRLVADSIKHYIDYLFYENVNDPSVRLAKKYDYRTIEKPTGEEAGSWRCALNATSSWVQK